ncbi:MAG: hypothetical protein U0269_31480 [Polyangiales bacterium]
MSEASGSSEGVRVEAVDAIEREETHAHGAILHREKVVSRALAGMMGAGALFFLLAGGAAIFGEPNAPLWALAFPFVFAVAFAFVGLTKPVLRTTVTNEEVYALHGLREARVPMEAIESVVAVDGTREKLLGAELVGPAITGKVTLITWSDAKGATHKCAISSDDAERLAALINRVRDQRRTRLSSVRVLVDALREEEAREVASSSEAPRERSDRE